MGSNKPMGWEVGHISVQFGSFDFSLLHTAMYRFIEKRKELSLSVPFYFLVKVSIVLFEYVNNV